MDEHDPIDPIADAIEMGWVVEVYVNEEPAPLAVRLVAATSSYLACVGQKGDACAMPWHRIKRVVVRSGAKRADW